MIKKILPFLIILLVVVPVTLFLVFFKDRKLADSQIDAMEAVPMDAIMAIEAKSIPSLLQLFNTRQQIKEDLSMISSLEPFINGMARIDSVLTGEGSFSARYGIIPGVFSLHQTGDDSFEPLLVLQSSGRFGIKDVADLSKEILGRAVQSDHKTYARTRIDQLIFDENDLISTLYVCQVKKYVLLSTNDILMENAIRQLKEGVSLNQDEYFRKASSVAGLNADAGLYVNTERLGQLSERLVSKEISSFLKKFNQYGTWAELDLTLREDMISGSGFGFAGDTLTWLGIFNRQDPPKNRLDKTLPANTIGFISYGFTNPENFLQKMEQLYHGSALDKKRDKALTEANHTLGEDVLGSFGHFLDKEAALAWIPGADDKPLSVAVMTLKSQNMAAEKLTDWLGNKARKEGKTLQDYRRRYNLDSQTGFYLYQSPVLGIPGMLFGEMFSEVQGKYFGFIENELVFADSPEAIRDLNYFKVLDKTLYTDPVYQSVISQIGMRNNFVFYLSPFRSAGFVDQFLGRKWSSAILSNPDFLKRTAAISLQIQSGSNGMFHNFFVKFSGSELSGPQTVWESRLDTTLNFKPVFTTNHNTKRKEILLQDERHNLYLINTSGRQLWKVPLKEAVVSEVYQIDYYKNGKLQFLFSTASALHLIDRNGNYVANYPVMLRSEASNGMALFDYGNRKEYRIFIAGKDKGIYVYDKTGALVKGWTFGKTEGLVEQEINHFRIGSRDYIVFADGMRVYITDRRGSPRVTPEKQFAKSARNGLVLDRQSAEGARLVGTDVNGMIWYIYFNGKVVEQKTEGYSANHYFVFEDIDGDGRSDFVFADQDRLDVIGSDGKRLFREKVDGYITHAPNIYVFPGNSREIGIVNRNEERIYLFKADGRQHAGFPLRGRTPFSIGYLEPGVREFNLIVGGDDKFLLNYRVK